MTQHYGASNLIKASSIASSLCTFFILLLCSSIAACAQGGQSTDNDDVVRVRTDLVTVPAYVTDAHGLRVAGLAQTDFAVRDNGQSVALSYFAEGTDHVALLFALDASGSIREVINEQRDAALSLFSRFGHDSRVAVLHFGEEAELTAPFTTDAEKAEAAFNAHSSSSQRTAIFDAVDTGLRAFAASKNSPTERRILILISDGLDNVSATRPSTVINDARFAGVSIYVIHLPLYEPRDGRLEIRPAAKGFRELAEKTGGRYFIVGDAKSALDPQATPNLEPVFKAIEEDLQGQYVLGYYPSEETRSAAVHRIEVTLTRRSERKLRVQALREEYNLKQ
ncbi:MAG TPA: VWA domain-containing protein [Pyrinomonadaceae bacterium]